MTDRELDALIAEKVMGLKPCRFHQEGSFSAWSTVWRCDCDNGTTGCFPVNKEAIDHPHSMLPHYSSDIAAAMEIVPKMSSMGHDFDLSYWGHDNRWGARFPGGPNNSKSHHEIYSNTAPRAIVLAALKAKGIDVDG